MSDFQWGIICGGGIVACLWMGCAVVLVRWLERSIENDVMKGKDTSRQMARRMIAERRATLMQWRSHVKTERDSLLGRHPYMRVGEEFAIYSCPGCKGDLRVGPGGGSTSNMVCGVCRVNYGSLPGAESA